MAVLGSWASTNCWDPPPPRTPPDRRSRYTSINTPGWGGRRRGRGWRGVRPWAGMGVGGPGHHWNVFSHTPAPSPGDSLADHLAQLVHILEQHVVVGHGPEGTAAAAWRAPKTGVGALKSSVPAPWLAFSPQDPRAFSAEDARVGLQGPETAAPSSAGDRPGAGGGAGAQEWGRPGPDAARPPARLLLALLGPRSPGCGSSGTARRRALRSSAHGGREATTAPSAVAGSGAVRGSSGYRGGRCRTTEGGTPLREVAAADRRWGPGGGGRDAPSSFSSSRRRHRPPGSGRRLCRTGPRCRREPGPLPSAPPPLPEPGLACQQRAPTSRTHALLLRGLQTHRPRPLQPVGKPVAQGRQQIRVAHACSAGHVTANRRVKGISNGWGVARGHRRLQLCRWGLVGVVTSATQPRKGLRPKVHNRTHIFSYLQREAWNPGRSPPTSFVTAGSC